MIKEITKIHLEEHTEYEVSCDYCANSTDRSGSASEIVRQANELGFRISPDNELLCASCLAEKYPEVDKDAH